MGRPNRRDRGLRSDGTDRTVETYSKEATGHRFVAKINLGALTQTDNFVVGDSP